jgi:putative SOS response-associated peptidase YedK
MLDGSQRRGNGNLRDHHDAARNIAHIHDRMPGIVPPDAFDFWLDCANGGTELADAALRPALPHG